MTYDTQKKERGFTPAPMLVLRTLYRKVLTDVKNRSDFCSSTSSCVRMRKLHQHRCRGFTVLFSVLIASIVLVIGLSILDLTLKQLLLAGVVRDSEEAFQAATAGIECALYHDSVNDSFDVDPPQGGAVSINCFNISANSGGAALSGEEQLFEFDLSDRCARISVYKFFDAGSDVSMSPLSSRTCPANRECTVVRVRGYNNACGSLTAEGTVERELSASF